jgi:hypothetical protein
MYFFFIINKSQHSKNEVDFGIKALATDMAFASTLYIKAGIDAVCLQNNV